jgi:hypothetical protein
VLTPSGMATAICTTRAERGRGFFDVDSPSAALTSWPLSQSIASCSSGSRASDSGLDRRDDADDDPPPRPPPPRERRPESGRAGFCQSRPSRLGCAPTRFIGRCVARCADRGLPPPHSAY